MCDLWSCGCDIVKLKLGLTNIPPGIGLMIAQALEANGAKHVYIVGRRADVLERAARTAVSRNILICRNSLPAQIG